MTIYCNGKYVGTIFDSGITAAKEWIKNKARIGTHIGEWFETTTGYEYTTTVGQYYEFVRSEII